MSMVYAGICCHAPGITSRPEAANQNDFDELKYQFSRLKREIEAVEPDAIFIISAEHYANFFNNNMPTYAIGMAQYYEGPIEDSQWLGINKAKIPGNADLSKRIISLLLNKIDVSYSEEWRFDHGMMVPLHHLTPNYDLPIIPANINCQAPPFTPFSRSYEFGMAIREVFESIPERIALIGTGGTSHWPCTPDSGKINEEWDREFLCNWKKNNRQAMFSYKDEDILSQAGQGAFEIRTSIAVAGAAGGEGEIYFYKPIPEFACGCLVASMKINKNNI